MSLYNPFAIGRELIPDTHDIHEIKVMEAFADSYRGAIFAEMMKRSDNNPEMARRVPVISRERPKDLRWFDIGRPDLTDQQKVRNSKFADMPGTRSFALALLEGKWRIATNEEVAEALSYDGEQIMIERRATIERKNLQAAETSIVIAAAVAQATAIAIDKILKNNDEREARRLSVDPTGTNEEEEKKEEETTVKKKR